MIFLITFVVNKITLILTNKAKRIVEKETKLF
jgi:hypothetical protein